MKRMLVTLLVITMVATSVFAAGASEQKPQAQQEKTITLATGDAIGTLRNRAGEYFKAEIEKRPELNLKVNHVQGAVLGTANQIMDQVVEGSVHLFGNDIAWIVPYDPDFQPISFGFMYRDVDHMNAYFKSRTFLDLADEVAKSSGMRIIAPVPMASRMFFSVKPLNTVADFRGLKVRAPGLEMFVKSYEAYGASPTTVAWNEIFLALRTKLVEAAHGPVADVIANKWHLAAPYITRTEDMYAANAWYVNERFWNGLSAEQRKGIEEALDATNAWSFKESQLSEQSLIDEMVKEGAVYNPSFADRERLREQAIDAVKKLEASGKWSLGLVDAIQAIK